MFDVDASESTEFNGNAAVGRFEGRARLFGEPAIDG